MMTGLFDPSDENAEPFDMRAFSRRNRKRSHSENGFNHPLHLWSLSEWMTAILSEVGEAAHVLKTLHRRRDAVNLAMEGGGRRETRYPTTAEIRKQLEEEIADIFIYLDLFAQAANIDLATAVENKFQKTSEKIGYRDE